MSFSNPTIVYNLSVTPGVPISFSGFNGLPDVSLVGFYVKYLTESIYSAVTYQLPANSWTISPDFETLTVNTTAIFQFGTEPLDCAFYPQRNLTSRNGCSNTEPGTISFSNLNRYMDSFWLQVPFNFSFNAIGGGNELCFSSVDKTEGDISVYGIAPVLEPMSEALDGPVLFYEPGAIYDGLETALEFTEIDPWPGSPEVDGILISQNGINYGVYKDDGPATPFYYFANGSATGIKEFGNPAAFGPWAVFFTFSTPASLSYTLADGSTHAATLVPGYDSIYNCSEYVSGSISISYPAVNGFPARTLTFADFPTDDWLKDTTVAGLINIAKPWTALGKTWFPLDQMMGDTPPTQTFNGSPPYYIVYSSGKYRWAEVSAVTFI